MRLSAFDTYSLYLALKNHFTRDSYDFFRYHGKTNASHDSFMGRKDRYQFQKLSRLYDESELTGFIVANLLAGKSWVGDLLDEDAQEVYKKYTKINQSLSYHFTNELDRLFTQCTPSECFRTHKNEHPIIFMEYLSSKVSIQTMVILNTFIDYEQKWNVAYNDDFLWNKHSSLIKKYTPFLEYDKTKLKNILKDKIKEYEHGKEQDACPTSNSQRDEAA